MNRTAPPPPRARPPAASAGPSVRLGRGWLPSVRSAAAPGRPRLGGPGGPRLFVSEPERRLAEQQQRQRQRRRGRRAQPQQQQQQQARRPGAGSLGGPAAAHLDPRRPAQRRTPRRQPRLGPRGPRAPEEEEEEEARLEAARRWGLGLRGRRAEEAGAGPGGSGSGRPPRTSPLRPELCTNKDRGGWRLLRWT
ncbi:filaggrin-2-like [Sarcophilus harrisii]|uniref:filaggrin-2-like n=1 Tax=Sarcophilus harrisii TaxID=9305 RepID=UPI001301F196|nr:filaggrin-2-like [Sarcophilus harrisii]